jgi:CheY-like chemotaxis protein
VGKRKVLCVDDNPQILAVTQILLESQGYAVAMALNGVSALARSREQFDAVVVGYEMPDMNGALLAKHLRSVQPQLPIVLFTGHYDIPSSALQDVTAVVLKDGDSPQRLIATLNGLVPRNDTALFGVDEPI